MQMIRGQIWLVDIEIKKGSQQFGLRPVILCSNNAANTFSPVLHGVPITSQKKRWMPTHTTIYKNTSGLLMDSTALCEQSMLIPKSDFKQCIGMCDEETMERVNECISIQFGLVQKERNNAQYA